MAPHGIRVTELAFADLAASFGDLLVARSRGEPAPEVGGSTRALARRYRRRRRAFDGLLDGTQIAPGTAGALDDPAALENMQATLEWFDELEPTPGARPNAGGTAADGAAIRGLRAETYRRYGVAASRIRVGSETIDRLTALGRLGSEPDPATRRAIFEAMAPVWRAVDGDGDDASPYRRLVASTAARWAAHGSTIEANATALGLAPRTAEATFRSILRAWRAAMGPAELEPWDYRYAVGAASRRLDPRVPRERLLGVNHDYLRTLGADPAALDLRYDVLPRSGRPLIPVAFTTGTGLAPDPAAATGWRPRPAWVFATYVEGGVGNLQELLHESGHALAAAGLRVRPAFAEYPIASAAFLEATADIVGWDVTEPAWQRRWLGDAADTREALLDRYGAVMLDVCWALFEIVVHRHPDRRPNDIWSEIAQEGLGVTSHPEWSWWAGPWPAHRIARLPRELRLVGDRLGGRSGPHPRAAWPVVGRRPGLVRLRFRSPVRGRRVAHPGGPAARPARRPAHGPAPPGRPRPRVSPAAPAEPAPRCRAATMPRCANGSTCERPCRACPACSWAWSCSVSASR